MSQRVSAFTLQHAAAIITWASVTGFSLYLLRGSFSEYPPAIVAGAGLAIVNLAAMLYAISSTAPHGPLRHVALWLQLATALGMGITLQVNFLPIMTIIWIAIATSYYSLRVCWWLFAGVLLAWYLVMALVWNDGSALFSAVLFGTFHLFAMMTARNAAEAQAAREKVELLNRELVATQYLLAEASRVGERTRIARDLHDLLGHHLTALSINLQIAERQSSGDARAKVEECRALARLLLSDVRDAVSELRDDANIDFAAALALLVDDTPGLDITLDIADDVAIDDVELAETLLRCVQEAITNTLKHSGARRSWVRVANSPHGVQVEIRDDGNWPGVLDEGNGLQGMRERLAALQGSLRLDSVNGALRLRIDVPVAA